MIRRLRERHGILVSITALVAAAALVVGAFTALERHSGEPAVTNLSEEGR